MLQSLCKLVLPDVERDMVPRISECTENSLVDMQDEHEQPEDAAAAELQWSHQLPREYPVPKHPTQTLMSADKQPTDTR